MDLAGPELDLEQLVQVASTFPHRGGVPKEELAKVCQIEKEEVTLNFASRSKRFVIFLLHEFNLSFIFQFLLQFIDADTAAIRVSNLSENTQEGDLQELFKPFGHIARIYLAKDKITGQCKVNLI